jgi:hypothetical protein
MYCNYLQGECYGGTCNGCCYRFPSKVPIQEFNYECPDCHGKFNYPAFIIIRQSVFEYKCPFCNRIMGGLNV